MQKKVKIFGVPLDLGAKRLGVDMGPSSLRYAGLHQALAYNGIEFVDHGNLNINNQGSNHVDIIKDTSGRPGI